MNPYSRRSFRPLVIAFLVTVLCAGALAGPSSQTQAGRHGQLPPGPPTLQSAISQVGSVALSWTAPVSGGEVQTYAVYRSTTSGVGGSQLAVVDEDFTNYTDTTPSDGTTYYYEIVASNKAGSGPASNQLPGATIPPISPAPTLDSISSGVNQLTINWSAPASGIGITDYRIYRSTIAGSYGGALTSVAGSARSYVDTTTSAPTRYFYVVSAVNGGGESAKSNELSAVPLAPATVPSAPSLTATSQVGSIELSWTTPANGGSPITGYNVYRGTTAGGESTTAIASGLPGPTYQDTTVIIGTTYFYQVTAVNSVGESARSNEASTAATSSGPGSFDTQMCGGTGPACQANTVAATDTNTLVTNLTLTTNSTQSQTITESVGGPNLNGCSVPGSGLSATFNDTATDAGKTVAWVVHGSEAVAAHNDYVANTVFVGCLGLGTPWMVTTGRAAPYVAADGLYEAAPITCANDGAFQTSPGVFSNPCTQVIDGSALATNNYFEIDYTLPPGDGRIGGGL